MKIKIRTGFLATFVVSLFLALGCQVSVTAQSVTPPKFPADVMEVVSQPQSPLIITPAGIDQSQPVLLELKFTVRNAGDKTIKAFTISRNFEGPTVRNVKTSFAPLHPGQTAELSGHEGKANLNTNSKVYFLVDYVLFDDGSSWGENTLKESEFVSGFFQGQKDSIAELNKLRTDSNSNDSMLSAFFSRKRNIGPTWLPKSEKSLGWRIGFAIGYKIIGVDLEPIYQKLGLEGLPSTVDAFNELIKPIVNGV